MDARSVLLVTIVCAIFLRAFPPVWSAESDLGEIKAAILNLHDEGVNRLQEWIRLPSIAAEDRGFSAGPEYLVSMLKDAGFRTASIIETDGKPGPGKANVGRGAVNQKGPESAFIAAHRQYEGLVRGYTGPGGKTKSPAGARMTAEGALSALKTHLGNRDFVVIEVNMSGGHDPSSTELSVPLIQAQIAVLKRNGIDPLFGRGSNAFVPAAR